MSSHIIILELLSFNTYGTTAVDPELVEPLLTCPQAWWARKLPVSTHECITLVKKKNRQRFLSQHLLYTPACLQVPLLAAGAAPRSPGFHRARQQLSERLSPPTHTEHRRPRGEEPTARCGWSPETEQKPSPVGWQGILMSGCNPPGPLFAIGKKRNANIE